MLKRLAAAGFMFCAAFAPGYAANLMVPPQQPIARVTIPDTWETEESEAGYGAVSPDIGVSFFVERALPARSDNLPAANEAWLQQNDITPKGPASEQEATVAGMAAKIYSYAGTDDEGDTIVDFIFVRQGDGPVILLTLWASAEEREANKADLEAIKASLKRMN